MQLLSSFAFSNVYVIIALWRSQMPLLQGDSAAVAFILILKFPQKLIKPFDANSPPLSLNIEIGVPNILIQCFKKFWMIIFDCFLSITTPLLNRENSSMKCKYQRLSSSWWRSIATISLKFKDFGIDTAGLGSSFLYNLQMLHYFVISSIIFEIFFVSTHAFFIKFNKLLLEACSNCLFV